MSKLKLQVALVGKDDLDKARESGGGFTRYDGPTPPPGDYKLKLSAILYDQYKTGAYEGKDRLSALFEIQDEDYKGAQVRSSYTIPFDPEHEHFPIHISTLDRFMLAVTNGEMDIQDFVKAANEDRILIEDTKNKESGYKKVTQIGKFKIEKAVVVDAHTKNREAGGKTYIDIAYFNGPRVKNDAEDGEDVNTDFDDDDLDLGDDLDI